MHTPENLRVATRQENARKGNRALGTLGDELWDCDHYSVYWPGETMTLAQKRLKQAEPLIKKLSEAMKNIRAQTRARNKAEVSRQCSVATSKRGRKPMTKEKALAMPAVQALLAGVSVREVMRQFSVNGHAAVRYARLVNPDYISPFHKHGRPQEQQLGPPK